MSILKTVELKKYYGSSENEVHALNGVNFSVEEGEFVSIVGTSGSGKSTLLHMLGGLDRPTSGKVFVDGKDIFSLKDEELTIFRRRKIGFVFQSYNLVPVLNVYENIVLPIELDGNKVDKGYVKELINTLGIKEKLDNLPNQLSGGQQQRVAIGRALMNHPALILADEPTGNLDSKATFQVMDMICSFARDFHQTVILVSHDPEMASYAHHIVTLLDGGIIREQHMEKERGLYESNTISDPVLFVEPFRRLHYRNAGN